MQLALGFDAIPVGAHVTWQDRRGVIGAVFMQPQLGGLPQATLTPVHPVAARPVPPDFFYFDNGKLVVETIYLVTGDEFFTWSISGELTVTDREGLH